ncbi:hypothetical protein [Alkalilimnicola ehrlichii]|uniref:hypothetical protein n=1 Tax=Alkalilimnicola ehrlichii TaxID=351052 RepID=UPI003B9F125A
MIRNRCPEWRRWIVGLEVAGLAWPARRGHWDRYLSPFTEHEAYLTVKEVHDAELEYEQTARFQQAMEALKHRGSVSIGHGRRRTFTKEKDVISHFQGISDLLRSMAEHGYDLEKAGPISLAIGRDGTLIKEKHGHHRLAAAQLLGLDSVPFAVMTVHTRWLLSHFEVFKAHPDALRDALE